MAGQNKEQVQEQGKQLTAQLVIKKKEFVTKDGEIKQYYSYTVELFDETFKFKPDDADAKLLKHLLNKCDLQVEKDDSTAELVKRVVSGDGVTAADKAMIAKLIGLGED